MGSQQARDAMPMTAAFIDEMRVAFGTEVIDAQVQRGMRGRPTFHAVENGYEIGTPLQHGVRVGRDERGNSYLLDGPLPEDDQFRRPSTYRERYYLRLDAARKAARKEPCADVCITSDKKD